MRDFIIAIFSPLLQLNVLLSTIGGFVAGGIIGGMTGALFGQASFNVTTGLIFAAVAFANSAIISGAGLAIDRIRELMEEQVDLARRQQAVQHTPQTLSSFAAVTPGVPATSRAPISPRMQAAPVATAPAAGETRVCPQCGARYDINLTACDKCGAVYPKF